MNIEDCKQCIGSIGDLDQENANLRTVSSPVTLIITDLIVHSTDDISPSVTLLWDIERTNSNYLRSYEETSS